MRRHRHRRRRVIVQFHTRPVSSLDLKLFQSGGTKITKIIASSVGIREKDRKKKAVESQGEKRGVINARRKVMAYPG